MESARHQPAASVPPYVSRDQLAALTPWTPDAIEKMVHRGFLKRGVHYFQPAGRRTRLIFKWEAIVELIEGKAAPSERDVVGDRGTVAGDQQPRRRIDVEKATKSLQRLLA